MAKVFLGAMATYQLLYLGWLKLESMEHENGKNGQSTEDRISISKRTNSYYRRDQHIRRTLERSARETEGPILMPSLVIVLSYLRAWLHEGELADPVQTTLDIDSAITTRTFNFNGALPLHELFPARAPNVQKLTATRKHHMPASMK